MPHLLTGSVPLREEEHSQNNHLNSYSGQMGDNDHSTIESNRGSLNGDQLTAIN